MSLRTRTLLALLALAAAAPPAGAQGKKPAGGRKPNFILILADDLGYGDLGCYGSKKNRTPNLDRMARQGIRFTSFYAAANLCTPTRASILTGCYPQRVGLHQNEKGQGVLFPVNRRGISAREITLAQLLRMLGYATACVGKWHLGDQPPFLPTRHGFDRYFGIPYSNDMGRTRRPKGKEKQYPPLPLLRGEKVLEAEPDQAQLTRRYTEEAVDFITKNKDRPFFLYLAHTMPHDPLFASEKFRGKSANGPLGDVIEELDWSVGRILDALKELGLDENTLVCFTSDNGGPPRPRTSNAPLRGAKGTTWEGGHRVPFIARWPGHIPAGKICDEVAVSFDLLPTFAALAGGKAPADRIIDGKDIRPLLAGEPGARTHEAVFFYAGARLEGVRSGKWKLYLPGRSVGPKKGKKAKKETRPLELYNLEKDVSETTDVSAQHPEVVKRLQALAERCREDLGDGKRPGKNTRPPGHVDTAKPLTEADARSRTPGSQSVQRGDLTQRKPACEAELFGSAPWRMPAM